MIEPRELAAGLGFTEGPVWSTDGRLLVVSMSRGLVREVGLDGSGLVRDVEVGGGPNGLAEDEHGRFWVAQNAAVLMATRSSRPVGPGLQEIAADGAVRDVHGAFHSPNDLVLGPDGRIWFTDPDLGEGHPGEVYAHDRATGVSARVAGGLDFPNGLAFDPDGSTLYVAETRTGRIHRYARSGTDLSETGLAYGGVFATLPEGGPDGLAFDADGDLWAAAPMADQLVAFAPDGTPRAPVRFDSPTFPTNLCFAGPGSDVLVVTAAKGGRVLALDGVARGSGPLVTRAGAAS